ncbi:hypothetical protein HAX54_022443 [Datura stramonium]|uniref:Uncharacterized protein n=1 Tax=Datura stramonium TaxID=4076 RepID=A0ABS8UUK9_DATST|nr:hypothetical protein [Datura stramonium]
MDREETKINLSPHWEFAMEWRGNASDEAFHQFGNHTTSSIVLPSLGAITLEGNTHLQENVFLRALMMTLKRTLTRRSAQRVLSLASRLKRALSSPLTAMKPCPLNNECAFPKKHEKYYRKFDDSDEEKSYLRDPSLLSKKVCIFLYGPSST